MRWLILFGLWLAYASFGVTVASLAPLVPVIQADLGMSHSAMGSVMGAWQLVYIAAAVPCGILLDRLGGRSALVIGIVLVAASGLGRAFAVDFWTLLVAVMVFGVGGPIISSGAPQIVAGIFTGSQRGLAMGIYMTGPTLGGILALTLTHAVLLPAFDGNWRAVLLLWSGFSGISAVAWLVITGVVGPKLEGFGQPAAAAAGAGAAERHPSGVVIRQLLGEPAVRVLLFLAVGAFLFNHGLNNWLPELLRSGGLTAVEAGYWAAFPLLVGILGSLTIPRLATPARRIRIIFGLCVAAAVVSLALRFTDPLALGATLFLQGLVRSSLMTVLILTLMELPSIGERNRGVATGLFFSAAEIGGVLGPLGLGLLYDLSGGFSAALYGLAAVTAAMAAGALLLAPLVGPRAAAERK
jgi:MFS transporter, CP family, cyanate transporter